MFCCCCVIRAASLCYFCLKLGRNWLPLLNDVFRAVLLIELTMVSSRLVEFVLMRVFLPGALVDTPFLAAASLVSSLVGSPISLVPLLVIWESLMKFMLILWMLLACMFPRPILLTRSPSFSLFVVLFLCKLLTFSG